MITTHPNLGLLQWAHRRNLSRSAAGNPNRDFESESPRVMRPDVLVVCESPRGKAHTVSEAIAEVAKARGLTAAIATVDSIAPDEVTDARSLIAGCWMPGRAPLGDEPKARMTAWIRSLPPLGGKPVGVFCTYRFFPTTFADLAARTAETERCLAEGFESKAAAVLARKSIHIGSIQTDAVRLLDELLGEAL